MRFIEATGKFEWDAELFGGPDDGFRYTMIRRKKPELGLSRLSSNGERYVLTEWRGELAVYAHKPRKK